MGILDWFRGVKISKLKKDNMTKAKRIKDLEKICQKQDQSINRLMSDGLRHGSTLAAKYMADKKKQLRGK
ncbi:hypothetical protein EII17_07355 [Clostridiales bacterium COT073_COT-073]|nr:hypothetical protein EII17_07355 [Clostridiales bacterium COT073_COT-073]